MDGGSPDRDATLAMPRGEPGLREARVSYRREIRAREELHDALQVLLTDLLEQRRFSEARSLAAQCPCALIRRAAERDIAHAVRKAGREARRQAQAITRYRVATTCFTSAVDDKRAAVAIWRAANRRPRDPDQRRSRPAIGGDEVRNEGSGPSCEPVMTGSGNESPHCVST